MGRVIRAFPYSSKRFFAEKIYREFYRHWHNICEKREKTGTYTCKIHVHTCTVWELSIQFFLSPDGEQLKPSCELS